MVPGGSRWVPSTTGAPCMSELAAAVAADDSPSCPVCLEHLADQCVTLSCSHGICSSCFAELSRTAREDGHDSITCPCCRKRFRIVAPAVAPADEVDEIEDNPRALFPDDLGQFIMNEPEHEHRRRFQEHPGPWGGIQPGGRCVAATTWRQLAYVKNEWSENPQYTTLGLVHEHYYDYRGGREMHWDRSSDGYNYFCEKLFKYGQIDLILGALEFYDWGAFGASDFRVMDTSKAKRAFEDNIRNIVRKAKDSEKDFLHYWPRTLFFCTDGCFQRGAHRSLPVAYLNDFANYLGDGPVLSRFEFVAYANSMLHFAIYMTWRSASYKVVRDIRTVLKAQLTADSWACLVPSSDVRTSGACELNGIELLARFLAVVNTGPRFNATAQGGLSEAQGLHEIWATLPDPAEADACVADIKVACATRRVFNAAAEAWLAQQEGW